MGSATLRKLNEFVAPYYAAKDELQGLEPVASRTFSKYVKELSERRLLHAEKLGTGRLVTTDNPLGQRPRPGRGIN